MSAVKEKEEKTQEPSVDDLQEQIRTLKSENEKLASKRGIAEQHLSKTEKALSAMQKQFSEMEAEKERLAEEEARKKAEGGDMEALESSYKAKLEKLGSEKDAAIESMREMVIGLTSKAEAAKLASRLFGTKADLLQNHVEARLSTEFAESGPRTRVLDEDGNPTAFTVDELYEEFKNDSRFADFVVASHGSGGGATGSGKGGGGATRTINRSQLDAMGQSERRAFFRQGGRVEG